MGTMSVFTMHREPLPCFLVFSSDIGIRMSNGGAIPLTRVQKGKPRLPTAYVPWGWGDNHCSKSLKYCHYRETAYKEVGIYT